MVVETRFIAEKGVVVGGMVVGDDDEARGSWRTSAASRPAQLLPCSVFTGHHSRMEPDVSQAHSGL